MNVSECILYKEQVKLSALHYRLSSPMIAKQLPSTKRQHPSKYTLGLIYLLLAVLQPLVIKADLNGVEACQNRCFNQSKCDGVGNGLCCQWDDDIGQCISSIGHDICPGTTAMSLPPGSTINCPPAEMILVETTSRNLSNNQDQSAPSASPTTYDDRCMNIETMLEGYLCHAGYSISQMKTLTITSKITAGLSILGSSYIIQDVLCDPKNEMKAHITVSCLDCPVLI